MGLVDGAIEQDRWNELVAQVALAVLEVLRHRAQARSRGGNQLFLRPQSVQEEPKDAAQPRVEIRVGVAAPGLPAVEDPAAMKARDRQVAIDHLVEVEAGGVQ